MNNKFKIILSLLIVGLCCLSHPAFAKELNVLFIGNSYIYFNDLPNVLEEMLSADGFQANVVMVAKPGWKLSQHANAKNTIDTILNNDWDYVILQEQSVLPVFPKSREKKMIPAIKKLDKYIKEAHAKTVLFMTWGRRDGLPKAGFANFNQMQNKLSSAYKHAAKRTNTILAPVGEAWSNARKQKPFFPLWQDDGSHPSKNGTYLTAFVFYKLLTGKDPSKSTYNPKLTVSSKKFLQKIANETDYLD